MAPAIAIAQVKDAPSPAVSKDDKSLDAWNSVESREARRAVTLELMKYLPGEFESFAVVHRADSGPSHPSLTLSEIFMRVEVDLALALLQASPRTTVRVGREFVSREPGCGDWVGTAIVRFDKSLEEIRLAAQKNSKLKKVKIGKNEAIELVNGSTDRQTVYDPYYLVFLDDHTLGHFTCKSLIEELPDGKGLSLGDLVQLTFVDKDKLDLAAPLFLVRSCKAQKRQLEAADAERRARFKERGYAIPDGFILTMSDPQTGAFRMESRGGEPGALFRYFEGITENDRGNRWRLDRRVDGDSSLLVEGTFNDEEDAYPDLAILTLYGYCFWI